MPRWLPDGSGFLWSTPPARLADAAAARRRRARWCARCRPTRRTIAGSCTSTPRARVAWFEGSPTAPETQVYRVSLDGGAPEQLTKGPGVHQADLARKGDGRVWIEWT